MKSDEQLVRDLKAEKFEAMGELHARYFEKVHNRCLSIAKNESDAYDCANDAILISFEKIKTFKENSSYSTWLYAIATNYTFSYCKKLRKELEINTWKEESFFAPEEFELIPQKDIAEILEQILDSITIHEKELLIEKYSYRLSIEELQAKYGLGTSAMKMRLARAKQKVQQLYVAQFAISA